MNTTKALLTAIGICVALSLQGRAAAPSGVSSARKLSDDFAKVAEKMRACVVSVTTEVVVRHPFFGTAGRPVPRGTGSGVLVGNGYVLTNNHVIEDADRIQVELADGRQAAAKLIGADPRSEVAVIQVTGVSGLPAAELGDSDQVRVGDWVLAIGSPFRLEQTVTAGIISAKGRADLGVTQYEDFLQTDAAINPGNSGGPLVDLDGKVIGINTFILSESGGSQGLGFAIPINMARNIMQSLIKEGKVVRGYLGVQFESSPSGNGVRVVSVEPNSPAGRAGLQAGDVITAFNSKPAQRVESLRSLIKTTPVGEDIELTIIRKGQEHRLKAAIAAEPPAIAMMEALGISVDDSRGGHGVVVTGVEPTGNAAKAGLRRNDLIVGLDNQEVTNANDFVSRITRLRREEVGLQIVRGRRLYEVTVSLK